MLSRMPRRLIDLSGYRPPCAPQSQNIRVVDTRWLNEPYCALSYRWPATISDLTMLSGKTQSLLYSGFDAGLLHYTIKDACELCKRLGFRYLWVDALVSRNTGSDQKSEATNLPGIIQCIFQGEGGDWHIEAQNIASIYFNAVVTIAAVDGSKLGAASSLKPGLYDEEALQSSLSKITEPSCLTNELVYEALQESGNFASRAHGELDTRGWAFQEKILSRRIISITKEGIFWDCLRYSASDRRPLCILGDFSPGFRDVDDRKFKVMLLAPHSSAMPATLPKQECYWHWRKAVKEYTGRVLTSNRDRHIALAGITAKFCSVLDDECVLGIWRNDALRSLLWSLDTANEGNTTASEGTIKGPSWSWVSICEPIRYSLPLPTHHGMGPPLTVNTQKTAEALEEKAKILELSVKRRNEFSFDEFDGSLVIEGASLKGFVFNRRVFVRKTYADTSEQIEDVVEYKKESTGQPWMDVLRHDEGTRYDERLFHDTEFFPDAGDHHVSDPQEVTCLLLVEGGYAGFSKARYFLVLEPKDGTVEISYADWNYFSSEAPATAYRRLGICAFDSWGVCPTSVDHATSAHDECPCLGTRIIANIS